MPLSPESLGQLDAFVRANPEASYDYAEMGKSMGVTRTE